MKQVPSQQQSMSVSLTSPVALRVKICGITQPEQGCAIAQLGATALGFICVTQSPRYITPPQIREIVEALPQEGTSVDRIGVFVNASLDEIAATVAIAGLTGVQLHGGETPDFCTQLRQALPQVELIKALRIRATADLAQAQGYQDQVDALLLDAYHPHQFGGTGQTLDWQALQAFRPRCSWLLAGGLTPENIGVALRQLAPNGIDLSSGVERSPGDKDLDRVTQLFEQLRQLSTC